ncbi:uncharacterized [Tachysurus ichikawai]
MNGRLVKEQGSETCPPTTTAPTPSLHPSIPPACFFPYLGLEACPRQCQDKSEAFSGPDSFSPATKGTR